MNILVIGSGGREFALVKSLLKSDNNIEIYGMGEYVNPGILNMVKGFKVMELFNINDFIHFLREIQPRFVVIGPEKYLNIKIGEILFNQNIPCIGPLGIMAKIETSKIFCRQFLKQHNLNIFSPRYSEINRETNLNILFKEYNNRFVLKPNGLTGGKGVKIFNNNNDEAKSYVNNLLKYDSYLLLEDKLEGEEFILLSFCDGKNIKHMPLVKDFKRVKNNSDLTINKMDMMIKINLIIIG